MRARIPFALGLAAFAFLAATGAVGAQERQSPDSTEILIGTFLVSLGAMLLLTLFYGLKVALGLERQLPPDDGHQATESGHH